MKWQDPPRRNGGSGRPQKYLAEAAELRANPNRWALLMEAGDATMAYKINGGGYVAFPRGEFEARARGVSNGRADIYVRYVGDES